MSASTVTHSRLHRTLAPWLTSMAVLCCALATGTAAAQSGGATAPAWKPSKSTEFIVPSGAGAALDQAARKLTELLARDGYAPQFVVSNKSGAHAIAALESLHRHPGDAHTLMTLSMAAMLSPEVDVRFSTLCHDLGKGLTPKEFWPRHHGHGPAGVKLVEGLCQRLRVPNEIRDLAKLVAEFHDLIHTFPILKPATIVKLFDNIDAWRKPQRVEQIALTSEADVRGRTGFEASDYPQGRLLREAWIVAKAVPTKDVVEAGFKGPEIREELTKRRIQAVSEWKEKHCPQPKD